MTHHSLSNRPARFFIALTVFTTLMTASSVLATEKSHCFNSPATSINTVERGDWISAGTQSCFRVDVPEEGLLFVEAHASAMPWLSVDSCDGTSVRSFSEVSSKMIVEASAQSLVVCLEAADLRDHLEKYRIDLAFAPSLGPVLKSTGGEDDREEEVEPEGLTGGDEDDREEEVEPDGFAAKPSLEQSFDRMCDRRLVDDHDDMMTCAVSVTDTVLGEIHNDWNDDVDVFALDVVALDAGRRVITIATQGAANLLLEVVDEDGRTLESTPIGQELTLVAATGRYLLRVTGVQGGEGNYSLDVETLR